MGTARAAPYFSLGKAETDKEKVLAFFSQRVRLQEPQTFLTKGLSSRSGIKVVHRKRRLLLGESGSKVVCPPQPLAEMDACIDGSLQCITSLKKLIIP